MQMYVGFFSVWEFTINVFSRLTHDACSCFVPLKCFIIRIIAIECFWGEMVDMKISTMLFSIGFVGCMLCYIQVCSYIQYGEVMEWTRL